MRLISFYLWTRIMCTYLLTVGAYPYTRKRVENFLENCVYIGAVGTQGNLYLLSETKSTPIKKRNHIHYTVCDACRRILNVGG